ncbi:Uu.00g014970.m01.CDS01 [Anthostomella pinea]|uniref:Uu.00g014970.m01.CDS01 n=1 Tax=Anthostomella pinea TaxID=933095 RepID=A0AAI8VZN1_9PEZI|nr:Uu.00g014970.m01.CDS01 [Anthostomella pinea]
MEDYPCQPSLGPAVEVRHATFTWDHGSTESAEPTDEGSIAYSLPASEKQKATFTLQDINLSIRRGELLAVIGSIGSGKTSLLSALGWRYAQDIGRRALGRVTGHLPPAPLDSEYDGARKHHACSLTRDLDILSHGDATVVGEGGAVLSGGQKQRISLARAMYSRADVVLLDDPLSAVDANVGRTILDNAICGQMSFRTRVLATRRLHMLHRCDHILWLEEGRVRAIDTHANLMAHEPEFARMVEESRGSEKVAEPQLGPGTPESKRRSAVANRRSAIDDRKSAIDNRNSWFVPDWMHTEGEQEDKLMQDEDQETRSVSWNVYGSFVTSSKNGFLVAMCLPLLVLAQGCVVMTSLWLAWWSQQKFALSRAVYIGIYASLATGQFVFLYLFSLSVATCCVRSSRNMMNKAIGRVLRAPISFFDTTPLGRLLNRFSNDVETMDLSLPEALRLYLNSLSGILAIFALVTVYFHWAAIAVGVLLGILLILAQYYRTSAREIKRHESVFRSGAFSRFVEGLSGVSTIRAFGMHAGFSSTMCDSVDDMNSAYFLTFVNQRWLSLRLDLLSSLLMVVLGILVLVDRQSQNPAISGLVLSLTLNAVQLLQVVIREWADVENAMNSMERLYAYANSVPQETDISNELTPAEPAPEYWPSDGDLNFSNVRMRYRPGLPEALQGIDMNIHGGERVAIVGRTGAGKSSIVNVLFRMSELSAGCISIDGQDISQLRLEDLRTMLSIIPQETTLFSGTVRTNLDPFDTYSDPQLWDAIRTAGLQGVLHLSDVVDDEGANLSLGQKQLLALARVLVRRTRIVVCDEATAALDTETDERIQRTMRTAFRDKTVLYIAHRLRTVLAYDRICVMDRGRVAEFGTPLELFGKKGSIFRDMCIRDGISGGHIYASMKSTGKEPVRTFQQPFGEPFEQSFEQFFAQWV